MENQVHEKIWRGIVQLWAMRDQGVAVVDQYLTALAAQLDKSLKPITDYVEAYKKRSWWKKILW
ncbi:hypothetical protein HZA71_00670 [Candidatus Falkowbacteria bacterium]|nr:hypothetical protein [Candidatus Falkowbacteria bacterium]